MKGGQPNKPQQEPDPANLDQSELVSNQQATVVPWMVGARAVAVNWISPVYDPFQKDAPAQGKK